MKYSIEVDNSQLISAIDFVKKMVSKDKTRPMLTAINFKVSGIYLTITACDVLD
jgi:DNA polymerase III sliding clamp (beta) subunit (PCNA family)